MKKKFNELNKALKSEAAKSFYTVSFGVTELKERFDSIAKALGWDYVKDYKKGYSNGNKVFARVYRNSSNDVFHLQYIKSFGTVLELIGTSMKPASNLNKVS